MAWDCKDGRTKTGQAEANVRPILTAELQEEWVYVRSSIGTELGACAMVTFGSELAALSLGVKPAINNHA